MNEEVHFKSIRIGKLDELPQVKVQLSGRSLQPKNQFYDDLKWSESIKILSMINFTTI